MTRILLVSHSDFAQGLLDACNMITGMGDDVKVLAVAPDMGFDEYDSQVKAYFQAYPDDELLVLADLQSGTPCNVTMLNCLKRRSVGGKCALICGVNLPMLIEAVSMKDDMGLDELRDYLIQLGSNSVIDMLAVADKRN